MTFDFVWFDVAYQPTICGYFVFRYFYFWYEIQRVGSSRHPGAYIVGKTAKFVNERRCSNIFGGSLHKVSILERRTCFWIDDRVDFLCCLRGDQIDGEDRGGDGILGSLLYYSR